MVARGILRQERAQQQEDPEIAAVAEVAAVETFSEEIIDCDDRREVFRRAIRLR
jgi:hypothetical protein